MRTFNINADCNPKLHYMVNIETRLNVMKSMVEQGQYFTINRARQYGKTTTLHALEKFLKQDYAVISLDFQMLSTADFKDECTFVEAFAGEFLDAAADMDEIPEEMINQLQRFAEGREENARLSKLFRCLSQWCKRINKKMVLIIDEVDNASNNQVFLDFLAQLRGYYIQRNKRPTFQSVILAGVYDIKNMKQRFSAEDVHKGNSPWNIAVDFTADMSFSVTDIAGMLEEYERDHQTGMDIGQIAQLLYDYTSGYPFLVSRLCKWMDEQGGDDRWSRNGVLEAVKFLLVEKNALFESLIGKLQDYPELKSMLYSLLFYGQSITYNPDDDVINMAQMFGFVRIQNENVVIANRIFETRIYNYFLTTAEMQNTNLYKTALQSKNQFIKNGHFDMRLVLERFVVHFNDLYGDQNQRFLEEDGRRYFLLYLKPIINGTGNYYIESRTRNMERTDVIVDYGGEQFVIELKIWRGNGYNTRGEEQLSAYLEHYHLTKGYMISFNFNKKKQVGVKEMILGNRVLVEAVV